MRDPAASLEFFANRVERNLHAALPREHVLLGEEAQAWVQRGLVVPFDVLGPSKLSARLLPFVTHPYEWCDRQFAAAAKLTLDLADAAVQCGYELKDASAWNVVFEGTTPRFVDLTSFVLGRQKPWWALGQFARHFILPLLLSRHRGMHAYRAFLMQRDGLDPRLARALLGWRSLDPRYAPLLFGGRLGERRLKQLASAMPDIPPGHDAAAWQRFRIRLYASVRIMLEGSVPRVETSSASSWFRYEQERAHYPEAALQRKREVVARWRLAVGPKWILDLGCNQGEFCLDAASEGVQVVAVDGDHDAVDGLYRRAAETRFALGIHCVLAALDDTSAGRGCEGAEWPGLATRLQARRFEVVQVLALIHHLAIAAAVPLPQLAAQWARLGARWLIIETIGQDDPQMRLLCILHQRSVGEVGELAQVAAISAAGFVQRAVEPLKGMHRSLRLFERLGTAAGPGPATL
jgi:hypothetical protein